MLTAKKNFPNLYITMCVTKWLLMTFLLRTIMPKRSGKKKSLKKKSLVDSLHFPVDFEKEHEFRLKKSWFKVPSKSVVASFEKGFYKNLRHLVFVDLRSTDEGKKLIEDLQSPSVVLNFDKRRRRIEKYLDSVVPGTGISKAEHLILGALDLNPYSMQILADFEHAKNVLERLTISNSRSPGRNFGRNDLIELFEFVLAWNALLPLSEKKLSYARKNFLRDRKEREEIFKEALRDIRRNRLHDLNAEIVAYDVLEEFANHTIFRMFLAQKALARRKLAGIFEALVEEELRRLTGVSVN